MGTRELGHRARQAVVAVTFSAAAVLALPAMAAASYDAESTPDNEPAGTVAPAPDDWKWD